MKNQSTTMVAIRIDALVWEAVKAIAGRNDRTGTRQLIHILRHDPEVAAEMERQPLGLPVPLDPRSACCWCKAQERMSDSMFCSLECRREYFKSGISPAG